MLELRNISKDYRGKWALNDISLEMGEGLYALLGPNGAGKSTLMNIISHNIRPSGGQVLWKGRDTKSLGVNYGSIIGYAPQQQGLYDSFSGRRFLSYMATLKAIPRKEMAKEIERVLSYVNLSDLADRQIGSYSGGMKQRILIAQAIMGDPQLIILDEPTAGLDPKERVNIGQKIKAMAEDKLILLSTHVLSDVESIAKELIFLKKGHIVDKGSVGDLCTKYACPNNLEGVYMKIFGEEGKNDKINLL